MVCPLAVEVCADQEPAMAPVRGRLAACHRAEEIPLSPALPRQGGGR